MSNHFKLVIFLSLGLLAVFGWHFATVFGIFGAPPQTQTAFFIRFGIIVAGFIIVSSVTAGFVASHDENVVLPDEREEKIELKVERNALLVTYGGIICLMWFVFMPMAPMQIANALLGIMCMAEVVKIVSGILYLHKGV